MISQQSLAKPAACAAVGLTCGILANIYRDSRLGLAFLTLGLAAVIATFTLHHRSK